MEQVKRIIGEPLLWLFYWCFQPTRFAREFDGKSARQRIEPSVRLFILLFLLDCPITLITRVSLRFILLIPTPHLMSFVVSIVVATLVGLIFGLVGGSGLGLTGAISMGLAGGIGFGLVVSIIDDSAEAYILAGIAGGLVITCMLSIAGGRAGNAVMWGIIAGVSAGLVAGAVTKLTMGNDVADMVIGCMVGMTAGIIGSRRKVRPLGGAHPRSRSLIIAVILTGVVTLLNRWIGGLVFALTFLLIFYRLPLYPFSGFASWKALQVSRKKPSQVFACLHNSSLYWDEYVYLPLPGLRQMLTIAAGQNVERALEELTFIVMERPLQIVAARFAALEIALRDLQMRDTLRDIAGASLRLSEIFPHGTGLIDPQWSMILVRLHDASQDAILAQSPVGWQARHNALEAMLSDLKQIYPGRAFNDVELNILLADIVARWRAIVLRELEVLEDAPEKTRRISNPYNPGPALERQNRLFVGRYHLALQIGEALSRSDHRPTFLLHGERRMGKSSILKHLPDLLGARFIPVFYDLQSPDSISSIAALLGMIAEEIVLAMKARGLPAKKLEYERLKVACKENEATVYYVFNRWLRGIEKALEREDRVLLLMFDEFEKLNWAREKEYLQLELLLNWFRSIIQHHPRLSLLFSGVQTFGDMGVNWASYFVNVQTLKVSFLQPSEAYQLITQPLPDPLVEQVFGEGVIEEILRVTGCHPFLVQALSSALIDALNARRRDQVELKDVVKAIDTLFKHWGSTYFRDLWERTSADQRKCLLVLGQLGNGDLNSIELQSCLDGQAVERALETLVDRDLVRVDEHGMYQLAAPIFNAWVERSSASSKHGLASL